MDEAKKIVKRTRKISMEKKVAAIDGKIEKLNQEIAKLEQEKEALLRPVRIQKMLKEAAEKMPLEEIAQKLGVPIE